MGQTKAADKPVPDVFYTDESIFPAGPYYNVRAGRTRISEQEIVVGEGKTEKRREAGFDLGGDNRVKQTVLRHRMDTMQNISSSFNPADLTCEGCKVRGKHSVVGADNGEPVVLVVSDQNFPPVLYSGDTGACIGVLRVEHGSIRDIGFLLADLLDGVALPAGSVILVSSVSDLARQGVSGYTEELTRTIRILREKQGKIGSKVQVAAIPPVLLGGVNSFNLMRSILEVEAWVEKLVGGEGALLHKTRAEVVNWIWGSGLGRRKNVEERLHTVPRGVEGYEKAYMRCTGWSNMPERVAPLSKVGEKAIMAQLVKDLKDNFGVRVSEKLVLDREYEAARVENEYVVWGGSNAGRLAEVMLKMGLKVVKVTQGGWRPSKQSVEKTMKEMEGKVSNQAILIMMGMDNGLFYEEGEDGSRSLPRKDNEGVYHVEGRLEVGTAKQAKGLLRNCMPILERYTENKKVFLSPTVRFYRTRCCMKEDHCTNMDTAGYRRGMLADLSVIRDAMLEVCREEGVQLYKVLGTCELLGLKAAMEEDEVERLLGSHPIHMTEEGYVTLAEQMTKLISSPAQLFVGEKREREEYSGSVEIGGWRRKSHEWLFNVVSGTGARKDSRFSQDNRPGRMGGFPGGSGALVRMGPGPRGPSGPGFGTGRKFYQN
jgi:hypothetical protein